jgi:hypothetical protein
MYQSRFLTRNTFMSIMDERTISGEYLVDGVRYHAASSPSPLTVSPLSTLIR